MSAAVSYLSGGHSGRPSRLRLVAARYRPQRLEDPVRRSGEHSSTPDAGLFSVFSFFVCVPPLGGVAYVVVFNSAVTWAATFRLRGYKCVLFPKSTEL